jgi:WD40 repeat protein
MLLSGSDDWTARLWDASSGKCEAVCVGHAGAVTAVQVAHSKEGSRLVTGAADGTVAVWGHQGELHSLVQQHWAPVHLLTQGMNTLVSGEAGVINTK